jgi:hypothetical protein
MTQNIPVRLYSLLDRAGNKFPLNFGDGNDRHPQPVHRAPIAVVDQPPDLCTLALLASQPLDVAGTQKEICG